jgi:DNA polymerase III delta prime subunit
MHELRYRTSSAAALFQRFDEVCHLRRVDNMTKMLTYLSYLMHSQYNDADGTNLWNYGSIVRFCLICNYISKIIPPKTRIRVYAI